MRLIFFSVVAGVLFYWLSYQGIVSFDNVKAKTYMENVMEKINPEDRNNKKTLKNMPNVDRDVSKLCTELKDLSERALRLRQLLLANVVDAAGSEKTTIVKRRYSKNR